METGFPAPLAWGRGGIGKVGFGGLSLLAADSGSFGVSRQPPTSPLNFGHSPLRCTYPRPNNPQTHHSPPHIPRRPPAESRGRLLHRCGAASAGCRGNPAALGLGFPATPGRLPGSGP